MHTHGGTDAKATAIVPARQRMRAEVLDVAHGHQAGQIALLVDEQELFDPAAGHERFGGGEIDVDRTGDEIVTGHDLADVIHRRLDELHVPASKDAGKRTMTASIEGDGEAGYVLLLHEFHRPGDGVLGTEGHGVGDNAVLGALDAEDLVGLVLDREILVDDPDSALLSERDGQIGLGDRVHGCRDQRNVDRNATSQTGGRRRVIGRQIAVLGNEQDVVERDAVGNALVLHPPRMPPRGRNVKAAPRPTRPGSTLPSIPKAHFIC